MPAPTKSLVTIPEEAIKRLRSLERLDESPFLQRKNLRLASGAAGSRRKLGSSINEVTSKKTKPAIAGTTPAIGGPETSFPVESSLGRRPRELPWLVTPSPPVNQAASPAAASSSLRPARPCTTPATVSVSRQLGTGGSGGSVGEIGLSRSRSIPSAGQGGTKQRRQQTGDGGQVAPPGADGALAGHSAFGQRAPWQGSGGSSGPSGNQEHEDDNAAEAGAAAAAAAAGAAALAESERARLRRQALTCAGSMEVPVGSSSSTSAAVRGGNEGGGEGLADGLSPDSVAEGSPLLEARRSAGRGVAQRQLLLTRQVLPSLPPPKPGSPGRAPNHGVRAAAWLAISKMVAFAERSSAALSATSAIPLDGLEAGLLRLVPFRFGNDGVAEDDDRLSQPSSSRSFTSSSSFLSSSDDGDVSDGDIGDLGAGGSSGGSRPKAGDDGGQDASKIAGFDHRRLAGRGSKSIRPTKAGQKQEHSAVATDKTATGPAQSPRQLPLTSPAADVAAGTKARPETRGSACGSPSAKHRKREKLRSVSGVTLPFSSDCRCDTTSSSQKPGWVRGASRDLASRGRGSPSRSRGERGTAKSRASGCWVPPPTRWGGTPIHSPSPWDDRGESFDGAAYEQANEGEPSLFRGGDAVRNGERAPEWDVEENGWGGLRGVDIFGTTGEFFRTADGRSLFAESLGNPSIHGGGGSKRRRPEIQWGGDDEYGDDSPFGGSDDRLGFLCLLGEEDYRAADRGNVEGKRLGVAARHRRTRIDARSRDGKRRAEGLSARRRIKRLEDECVLRRTDKLERRANLSKSRGEAAVRVAGDRGKTLLWVMILASRTCHLRRLLTEFKGRQEDHRSHLAISAFVVRIQRAWRSFREEARTGGTGEKTMRQTLDAIQRVSSKFVICRRARVLALLKLWPEGEAAVKVEMRTGKRIRAEGSWRNTSRRRSSRMDATQSSVPRGSVLAGGGAVGSLHGGGHIGHGSPTAANPAAVAAAMSEAAAAAAAATAAAPHVSPPWLPRLVKQMETRKLETVHRLVRTQEKLFRHRQANEAAWMAMAPVGRAYHGGKHHQHLQQQQQQQQQLLKHHTGHEDRAARDRGGFGSGSTGESGGSSVASARTDATISSEGSGTQQQQQQQQWHQHQEHRQKHPRASNAATALSEGGDSTQGSLPGSVGGHRRKEKRKKGRSRRRSGASGGGGARIGRGGEAGGPPKVVSISAESDLEGIFDGGDDGQDRSPTLGAAPAGAAAGRNHQFSRTTPASSSSGSIHRVLSATGGMQYSQHQLQHGNASHKGPAHMRDMTSLQLLAGAGWLARLSEIDKEIDTAPLVPLTVKLAAIESFLRAETMERMKNTRRDRASRRVHHEEATLATAKALLHWSVDEFVDHVEATHSSDRNGILQLYSGQARLRFMAEIDKKVRLHMEKGNRRAPVGVRT